MEFKDYYAALGLAPTAGDKEIKAAYRKLAREYHPDVNPGDKQAEDRFKEINEAYQALGDPEQRRKYDEMREQYQHWQQRGRGAADFNWNQWQDAPAGGATYTRTVSPEDIEDMFGGEAGYSDFFRSIFGGRAGGSGSVYEQRPRHGRDYEVATEVTLDEAFHGTTRSLQVGERTIEARIPRGVQTGSRVRLSGQGGPGVAGGPAGNLYLVIDVLPDERFEREGDDLVTDAPIDMLTAAVGGETRVDTLEGTVKLRVPPRTQAGTRFRLRGKGMPRLGQPNERGDMYVHARLVLPENLSDAELATLRELKAKRGGS